MVTGGGGFLGRSIEKELLHRGHSPFIVHSSEYDLREDRAIEAALWRSRPDAVIHAAAAVGGIAANVAEPGRFFYENALMGVQLLERCRLFGVSKVVVIGTACEYPEGAPVPLCEESIWDGRPADATAPYGIVKRALLEMGQAYRKQYGFDVIHVIPSNLYGPGDHFDGDGVHVVPALVKRFTEAAPKNPVRIWGDGSSTRDFLFVDEAARGIVQALERYSDAAPVNLGSGVETSISELAARIAHVTRHEGPTRWDASKPGGTTRRVLDITRARAFGFEPTVSLGDGLELTVVGYRRSRRA